MTTPGNPVVVQQFLVLFACLFCGAARKYILGASNGDDKKIIKELLGILRSGMSVEIKRLRVTLIILEHMFGNERQKHKLKVSNFSD